MATNDSTDDQRAKLLDLLVCLTVRDGIGQTLLAVLKSAKDQQLAQVAAPNDDLQGIRDALRAAVQKALLSQPDNPCWKGGELDWSLLGEVSVDFCTRMGVGLDAWDAQARDDWEQAVRDVTDVTSSNYR